MRIVHINVHYQDKLGYQDYYLGAEQVKLGHEVIFVSSDWHFDYPDYENTVQSLIGNRYQGTGLFKNDYGCAIHRLKGLLRFTGWIWLKGFKQKLVALQPDLVIQHGVFNYQAIRLSFFAKQLNCPVIYDDHTTFDNQLKTGKIAGVVFFLFRQFFAKRIYQSAHKVIGISDSTMVVLQQRFGIPKEKLQMVPLGADNQLFFPDRNLRTNYRKALGIAADELLVVYTGKVYAEKNVPLIFEALNDELFKDHTIKILVVGNIAAHYKAEFKALMEQSIKPVIQLDAIPASQLNQVYNAADIAVWPDSITNSTVDASAAGCAIICNQNFKERIKYDNGIGIAPGNLNNLKSALYRLLTDAVLRADMGRRGIELVEKELSWAAIAQQFTIV
jgi:glycosyltransferase involved in cell wall biosynthesis